MYGKNGGKKYGYPNVRGYHFWRGRPEKATTRMLGDTTFSHTFFDLVFGENVWEKRGKK
jgi:23S rRNA pseudoU1915 N3-methylase RlmH